MTTLGLKNVNMLTKEQYDTIAEPVKDELYAISGSGFGFPSSNYEDLELGASDTEYTAPANGWFYINKSSNSTNQQVILKNRNNDLIRRELMPLTNSQVIADIPVRKGDTVRVAYTTGGATNYFRFIYAEGE